MAALVTIELDGADEFQARLKESPRTTEEALEKAMTEALELLEKETKDLTPIGASGGSGGLRDSIAARPVEVHRNVVIGFLGSPLDYAPAVEFGTDPHYVDPEELHDWVRKKMDVAPKNVPRVAYFVSRAIKKFGTQPKSMFQKAFRANESQTKRMFSKALERVLDKVADV